MGSIDSIPPFLRQKIKAEKDAEKSQQEIPPFLKKKDEPVGDTTGKAGGKSGLIEEGNIDLYAQPSVKNTETGGMSTVFSTSIGTDKGEVLISRVTPDGKFLSEKEAEDYYRKTGKHLGVFKDVASANQYAEQLHKDYESGVYSKRPATEEPKTTSTSLPPKQETPGTPASKPQESPLKVNGLTVPQGMDLHSFSKLMGSAKPDYGQIDIDANKKIDDMTGAQNEDPLSHIYGSVMAPGATTHDKAVASRAAKIIREKILPDGYEAKKVLATTHFGNKGVSNLTATEVRNKAELYDKTTAPLRELPIPDRPYDDNVNVKQAYMDLLTNAAIKWRASNDAGFKRQLGNANVDLKDPDLKLRIDANQRGQTLQMYLNNRDVMAYVQKENPKLTAAYVFAAKQNPIQNIDYGINAVATEVSQAIQKSGYNMIEPIFNFDTPEERKYANTIAEGIYQSDPDKLAIYNKYIRDNQAKYLDKPSLVERAEGSMEDIFKGIKNSLTSPFTSREEKQRERWEEEAKTVNADPKGMMAFISNTGKATGFVLGLAAGGEVGEGLGLSEKVAQRGMAALTFFGNELGNSEDKYRNPLLAFTDASIKTGMFAWMSDIFPAAKAKAAFAEIRPEMETVIENLTAGKITQAAARKELHGFVEKAVEFVYKAPEFVGRAAVQNTKMSLEMTGITATDQMLDRVFGLNDEEFNKRHPSGELMNTFTGMFTSNGIVSGMAARGEMRRENKVFDNGVYRAASNPLQTWRAIESIGIKDPSANVSEMFDNLTFLANTKTDLDNIKNKKGQPLTEKEKRDYLSASLKEKVMQQKADKTTDETLKKASSEDLKYQKDVKENILKGETGHPTVVSAVVEVGGKEYEGKNHAEALLKAKADNKDITNIDRQAEGKFKLSDGTIIDRAEAMNRFGRDHSEALIPQDEAANKANEEYKNIIEPAVVEKTPEELITEKGMPGMIGNLLQAGTITPEQAVLEMAKQRHGISERGEDLGEGQPLSSFGNYDPDLVTAVEKKFPDKQSVIDAIKKPEEPKKEEPVKFSWDTLPLQSTEVLKAKLEDVTQDIHGALPEDLDRLQSQKRNLERVIKSREPKKEEPLKSNIDSDVDLKGEPKKPFMVPVDASEGEKITKMRKQMIKLASGELGGVNKYLEAINEGKMSADDAKLILESAGVKVPKEITDLIKSDETKKTTPAAVEPVNAEEKGSAAKEPDKTGEPAEKTEPEKKSLVGQVVEADVAGTKIKGTITEDDGSGVVTIRKEGTDFDMVVDKESVKPVAEETKPEVPIKKERKRYPSKKKQGPDPNQPVNTKQPQDADGPAPQPPDNVKEFNKNVDEVADAVIDWMKKYKLASDLPEGTQKSGAGLDDVVRFAAGIVKEAYVLSNDIKLAIEKAIQHVSDNWDKAWGDFNDFEKEFRQRFSRVNPNVGKEMTKQEIQQLLDASRANNPKFLERAKEYAKGSPIGRLAVATVKTFDPFVGGSKSTPSIYNDARLTAVLLRKSLGKMQHENEVASDQTEKLTRFFEGMDEADKVMFITNIERGIDMKDPKLNEVAKLYRDRMEKVFTAITSIKDIAPTYIEDYFPHFWADPEAAKRVFAKSMAKNPMEGSKGMLRARFYSDIVEGMKDGLKLVSTNPEDLVRLAEINAYKFTMAHNFFNALKGHELTKFYAAGTQPEGWSLVDDPLFKRVIPTKEGAILTGGWYMPNEAAEIVKRYSSRGLKGPLVDTIRGFNNFLNQAQLGISFFHGMTTTIDAAVTSNALGIDKILRGKIGSGLWDLGSGVTVIPNLIRQMMVGGKAIKDFRSGVINKNVETMMAANARTGVDVIYRTDMANRFMRDMAGHQYGKALLKSVPALFDMVAKPIFEHLVPRLKVGGLIRVAENELSKLKNPSQDQIDRTIQKAWDDMENRLGQMTYDNLFWKKTTKDIAFGITRSVGWNLGTIRAFAEGVGDLPKSLATGVTGKGISPRTAWMMALVGQTALMGAMTTYIMTGERPKDWRDYFYPRTGGKDKNGNDKRIQFPTYMRDVFNTKQRGIWHELAAKAAPWIGMGSELWNDKDFYGNMIRNPLDPAYEQGKQLLEYGAEQLLPFAFRSQPGEQPTPIERGLKGIGITPAPQYVVKGVDRSKIFERYRDAQMVERDIRKQYKQGTMKLAEYNTKLAEVLQIESEARAQLNEDITPKSVKSEGNY